METSTPPPENEDVVNKVLASLDRVLDVVHDKVLRPIILIGRIVAFSSVLFLAAVVLVSALVIGLVRLLDVYAFAAHPWITDVLVGALSLTVGLVIWRKRRPVELRK